MPAIVRVTVSIDDSEAMRSHPQLGPPLAAGELALHASGTSPADSVRDSIERSGGARVLVTTADHPLPTAAVIEQFLASGSELALWLVPDRALLSVAALNKRTWLRLGRERSTGANLFLA